MSWDIFNINHQKIWFFSFREMSKTISLLFRPFDSQRIIVDKVKNAFWSMDGSCSLVILSWYVKCGTSNIEDVVSDLNQEFFPFYSSIPFLVLYMFEVAACWKSTAHKLEWCSFTSVFCSVLTLFHTHCKNFLRSCFLLVSFIIDLSIWDSNFECLIFV